MRKLRLRNAVLAGLIAALVVLGTAATVAYADQTIYAGPPTQYIGGNITINQGEKVTFTNLDTVTHDVTAQAKGSDGKPLFASALTDPGTSQPVVGTEYLTTGSYQYFCSIHPYMTGTITVTSSGTPAQRPGSSSGGGSAPGVGAYAPSGASPGASGPTVSVRLLDTRLAAVRRRRALRVSVTTDQPAVIGLVARAGSTVIASGTVRLAKAGTKTVSLKLTRAGRKRVRRPGALTVSLSGQAGSSGTPGGTTQSLH